MHFPSRRQPYSPEARFDRPFFDRHFDDPYLYDDSVHGGMKRPFYMTVSFSLFRFPFISIKVAWLHISLLVNTSNHCNNAVLF